MILRLALTTALLLLSPCSWASPEAAVAHYLDELRQVETSKRPVSLEPLFAASDGVQAAVMTLIDGNHAWVETLDEDAYRQLRQRLRGMVLARGEDIYAVPDPQAFARMARKHGLPEDQAFFALYRDSWDADHMPRYLQLGTRATPCVRFSTGIVPMMYAQWRDYAQQYPQAYRDYTRQTLRDLEEVVTLGTCTCTDQADVESELSGFVERFPQSPAAGPVRQRLKQLRDDPDAQPVHCL